MKGGGLLTLQYLAGILDGEGTIGIQKHKHRKAPRFYYDVRVRVSNGYRDLITLVKAEYGGVVSKRKAKGKRKANYQLTWVCNDAVSLLNKLLPFLIIKREQALLALALPRSRGSHYMTPELYDRQIEVYQKMRMLNKVLIKRLAEFILLEPASQKHLPMLEYFTFLSCRHKLGVMELSWSSRLSQTV